MLDYNLHQGADKCVEFNLSGQSAGRLEQCVDVKLMKRDIKIIRRIMN